MGVLLLNGGRPSPPPVDVATLGAGPNFFDARGQRQKFCGLPYPKPAFDPKAIGELTYEEEATGKLLVYSVRQCTHCGQHVAIVKGLRQGACLKCGWICGSERCARHIDGTHPHPRVRR